MSFKDLGVPQHIVDSLKKKKITEPTNVQLNAIPTLLQGKDLIVRAKTGSGKTFAFTVPLVAKLTPHQHVQGIIIAPTRELALQIAKDFRTVDKQVNVVSVYGGVSINPQIEQLTNWGQVIVGTPGRILDHLQRRTLDPSKIKFAVIDEADRMFDMGFIDDIKKIMNQLPKKRQTTLFSATMPEEVVHLSKSYLSNPGQLLLDQDEITVKGIKQDCYGMDRKKKLDALLDILRKKEVQRTIIFCNTKRWAETLSKILHRRRMHVGAIHGDLSQRKRTNMIKAFKSGRFDILVATDVAARGLHIDNITHVVNYDLPKNAKDYVHRIGRTGRIGNKGRAISFAVQGDELLLQNIEREIQERIDVKEYGTNVSRKRTTHVTVQRQPSNGFSRRETITQVQQTNEPSGWGRWD